MVDILYFFIADVKSIKRDSHLLNIFLAPFLCALLIRYVVPLINYVLMPALSIEPYYPLINTTFFVVFIPAILGVIAGFAILNDIDEDMLSVIFVTPFSPLKYTIYRVLFPMLASIVYVFVLVRIFGLITIPLTIFMPAIAIGALLSPIFSLFIASFAKTKMEGLLIVRVSSVFLLTPIIAFFIKSNWELLLGILPTYWSFTALLKIMHGEPGYVAYNTISIFVYIILLSFLLKRFSKTIQQSI